MLKNAIEINVYFKLNRCETKNKGFDFKKLKLVKRYQVIKYFWLLKAALISILKH